MRGDGTVGRRGFIAGAIGAATAGSSVAASVLGGRADRRSGADEPGSEGDGPESETATGTREFEGASDLAETPPADPDAPAATFGPGDADGDVIRLADLPRSDLPAESAVRERFSLDVAPGAAVLTAPDATVVRPLEFALRLEDASGTERVYRATHGPATGPLAVRFDVGDVRLPTGAGRTASVRVRETGAGGPGRLVAAQHYLGVPYRLSDGATEIYWASEDALNGPIERRSGCVHEVFERGADYVVITAQRFRGRTFGASATIPKAHYRKRYDERFTAEGDRRVSSVQFAARRDDPHLNRYARDLAAAIERAGFTDPREKVLAVARTVQTMRYKWGTNPDGGKTVQFPLQLLINAYGVCSGRTVLLAYLLATEHFGGITTAYGDCRMRGVRHWAPGIDVRGFGFEPGDQPEEWYTFAPTEKQGFEYTEYAFLEAIAVRDVGEFDESIYTTPRVWDTVDLKYHTRCC